MFITFFTGRWLLHILYFAGINVCDFVHFLCSRRVCLCFLSDVYSMCAYVELIGWYAGCLGLWEHVHVVDMHCVYCASVKVYASVCVYI